LPFCHVTLRGQKPRPPGYPDVPKTLGDHLRKRRLDLGISQRALSERLRVSKRSVETWERNEVSPSRALAAAVRAFLGLENPPAPTPIADRLTAFRKIRGLSQAELARELGVHRCTVVRWERGRRYPGGALLAKFETLLTKLVDRPGAIQAESPSET
jgi:transcriptional regulator with XRE-family HTH domain